MHTFDQQSDHVGHVSNVTKMLCRKTLFLWLGFNLEACSQR